MDQVDDKVYEILNDAQKMSDVSDESFSDVSGGMIEINDPAEDYPSMICPNCKIRIYKTNVSDYIQCHVCQFKTRF